MTYDAKEYTEAVDADELNYKRRDAQEAEKRECAEREARRNGALWAACRDATRFLLRVMESNESMDTRMRAAEILVKLSPARTIQQAMQ